MNVLDVPRAVRPEPTGAYLRTMLDRDFTAEQLAVATAPLAPQLVVAGAGSGKTAVMAARVVHAVAFHGVAPGAVLGLTFTNKAAAELADRVRRALATLPDAGRTPDPDADDQPTVSTYHAYAAALVRDHALRIGREPVTTLLTEAGRWQVSLAAVRAARGPFPALDWKTATVAQYVLDLAGEMAEHLVDAAAVRAHDDEIRRRVASALKPTSKITELADTADKRDELLELVTAYEDRKHDLDLIDFGDQVALAAQIAEACPEVGAAERARCAVVLLDEYQDTGVGQRRLLSALFGRGHAVTAVGDPCQSIYGWRGASVGNLLRFGEHFPPATVDGQRPSTVTGHLSTSFRNGGRILAVANRIAAPLRAESRTPSVAVPELRAARGREDDGSVKVALHDAIDDEAGWVADEIAAALGDDDLRLAPGEVAVLCRRRADFPVFHEALVARDIPVEVVGLGGLLEMPEVADVVAVLHVLADPTANPALLRILTGPRYRIGPRDLAALGRRAARLATEGDAARGVEDPSDDPHGTEALAAATASVDPCDVVALTDALASLGHPDGYSLEAYERLSELAAELDRLRPLVAQPVVEAVSEVVAAIGLDVEVAAGPDHVVTARVANLAAFLDHAAGFEGVQGESDLAGFLGYLAAARDKEDGLDVGGVSSADTVKLLTVHKAKGLEWRMVAVPTLAAGTFPSNRGRPRWTTSAKTLPFALRGDCDDLPAVTDLTGKGLTAFTDRCRDGDLDEERRLAYVAVTRARDVLLVSGHRWNRTRSTPGEVSVFLEEARTACLSGAGEVVAWCDEPTAANPWLASARVDVPWPQAYDTEAFDARRRAAEEVRAALAGPQAISTGPSQGELPLDLPGATSAPWAAGSRQPATAVRMTGADARTAARWRDDADRLLAEVARDRSRERLVPLPASLSASQVVALANDPDGLARDLARPMPRRPSGAARRGTRFHAWVEQELGARPLLDTEALPGSADDELPGDEELAALRAAFAASDYAERTPVAVEAPFALLLGGRVIRGRIDAVFGASRDGEGGDGFSYEVVDWKTGRTTPDALQLAVYRLAWAELSGVSVDRVTAAFLDVRRNRVIRHDALPGRAELTALLAGEPPAP